MTCGEPPLIDVLVHRRRSHDRPLSGSIDRDVDPLRRLLALHPEAAAVAGVAPSKLVDWMIKFQFDGDVDYFEVDPVAYGPALGDVGMKAYRARLEAVRATLGPEPSGADRSVPDRHDRWLLQ